MKALTVTLICLPCFLVVAQTPLFQNEKPILAKMEISLKDLKKKSNDSTYLPMSVTYREMADTPEKTIKGEVRTRGNFRKANCFFPPMRFKLNKTEGTLFEKNKNLKLVLPCNAGADGSALIMKEYLCYRMYERITTHSLHTRLVTLTLTDTATKSKKSNELTTFLIEDDDQFAKRLNGKIRKELKLHPRQFSDTAAVIMDFFQYMIANTDWSVNAQHNTTVLEYGKKFEAVPYDFDMAGVVNANYAVVSESLPITNVKERLYRGFCRKEQLFQYVRTAYLKMETEILNEIPKLQPYLTPKELEGIKKYITQFFTILKNDNSFKNEIIGNCRTS